MEGSPLVSARCVSLPVEFLWTSTAAFRVVIVQTRFVLKTGCRNDEHIQIILFEFVRKSRPKANPTKKRNFSLFKNGLRLKPNTNLFR